MKDAYIKGVGEFVLNKEAGEYKTQHKYYTTYQLRNITTGESVEAFFSFDRRMKLFEERLKKDGVVRFGYTQLANDRRILIDNKSEHFLPLKVMAKERANNGAKLRARMAKGIGDVLHR